MKRAVRPNTTIDRTTDWKDWPSVRSARFTLSATQATGHATQSTITVARTMLIVDDPIIRCKTCAVAFNGAGKSHVLGRRPISPFVVFRPVGRTMVARGCAEPLEKGHQYISFFLFLFRPEGGWGVRAWRFVRPAGREKRGDVRLQGLKPLATFVRPACALPGVRPICTASSREHFIGVELHLMLAEQLKKFGFEIDAGMM